MRERAKVVLFDVGHTLVRGSEPSVRRLLAAELRLSAKETKQAGRLLMTHFCERPAALADVLKQRLPDRSRIEIEDSVEKLWERQTAAIEEIDGATALLAILKQRGFELALLSNMWHPFYEGLRRACAEMLQLIDHTFLSYQVGYKKPNVRFFRHALHAMGVPARQCWMVGDSYELDMAPAIKTGMRTIWLLNQPAREKSTIAQLLRGAKQPPDWVVENLEEIASFLGDREA